MEFIDFFLEHWLDGNLECPTRERVADIVFSDEILVKRSKELIDSTLEPSQRERRQRLYDDLSRYARRFRDLMERAEENSPQDAPE